VQPSASLNVISKRINCQVQRVGVLETGKRELDCRGDKGVMGNKDPLPKALFDNSI